MPAPEVDAWLQSAQYRTIGSLALRPRPHPLLPEISFVVSHRQAEVFFAESRDGQLYLIKKFHRGMALDRGYLAAIASLIPRDDAFASGTKRSIIRAADVVPLHPSPSLLADWLDGTVLMPKVNGVDWATVADRQRDGDETLSDASRAWLCESLARAVGALEQAGCTHRDLSSGNVLVDPAKGPISLIDWDSVRHHSLAMPANSVPGTSGYIAPFVWRASQVDLPATWAEHGDRFALALLSAEFLTANEDSALTHDGGMFDQGDLCNRSGKSIDNIRRALVRRAPAALPLLDRALLANSYSECPSPDEWQTVARTLGRRTAITIPDRFGVFYRKTVSRREPLLIVMILDDSSSMSGSLPGSNKPKYEWVEAYAGVIFKELLARSVLTVGDTFEIRSRYFIYVIPYGSHPIVWPSGASEELSVEKLILAYANAGNKLGLSGSLAAADTLAAFTQAHDFLKHALTKEVYRNSFPPMVFHLTDGESATNAAQVASQIQALSTDDGNVLVVNAFMGAQTNLAYSDASDFPGYKTEDEAGPGLYSKALFNMSSVAPDRIYMNLVESRIFPDFRQGSRLYFDLRTQDMLKNVLPVVGALGKPGVRN